MNLKKLIRLAKQVALSYEAESREGMMDAGAALVPVAAAFGGGTCPAVLGVVEVQIEGARVQRTPSHYRTCGAPLGLKQSVCNACLKFGADNDGRESAGGS